MPQIKIEIATENREDAAGWLEFVADKIREGYNTGVGWEYDERDQQQEE